MDGTGAADVFRPGRESELAYEVPLALIDRDAAPGVAGECSSLLLLLLLTFGEA